MNRSGEKTLLAVFKRGKEAGKVRYPVFFGQFSVVYKIRPKSSSKVKHL